MLGLEIAVDGRKAIDVAVSEAEHAWATALEKYFKKAVA